MNTLLVNNEFSYMYSTDLIICNLPIILVSVALGSDEFHHRSPIHVLRNIHTGHIQDSWGQVHIKHNIRYPEAIQRF